MIAALAASACTKDEGRSAEASAATADGRREERPEYVVELLPPDPVAAGGSGAVVVRVAAKGVYHVNPDYPLAFTPDAVDGLSFAAKRIALSDSAERTPCKDSEKDMCEARAKVPFTAEKPAKLTGVLAFSICEPERCLIEKARLSVAVAVK
jgi:hypothetical protein